MEKRATSIVLDVVLQKARVLNWLHSVSRCSCGIYRLLVQFVLDVSSGRSIHLSIQAYQQIAARDHTLVHTRSWVPDHSLHHFCVVIIPQMHQPCLRRDWKTRSKGKLMLKTGHFWLSGRTSYAFRWDRISYMFFLPSPQNQSLQRTIVQLF